MYPPNIDQIVTYLEKKYGSMENVGWSPQMRLRFKYLLPGEVYELLVDSLVDSGSRWIDVGSGSAVFPRNTQLSQDLSDRSVELVAVDPSDNVQNNIYASSVSQCLFEDYQSDKLFDLATFRMVVEHVDNPHAVLKKLSQIMDTDGVVVVYTINKYSPIPLVTRYTPFSWHYALKKRIWGGDEEDTFPVCYLMNTRKTLRHLFYEHGFKEEQFERLDDLSATINFRWPHLLENILRKMLYSAGLHYPEHNLLGVYRKFK